MTIASEANRAGPYLCNGVTTSFPFGFKVYDDTHVKVIITDAAGVDATLSLGSDYSVGGVGDNTGGSVVTSVAYAAGNKITILLNLPFTQGMGLENQGAFFAEVIERAFDEATQKLLQIREELSRAYKAPPAVSGGLIVAPEAFEEVLGNAAAVEAWKNQAAAFAAAAAASAIEADGKADDAAAQSALAAMKAEEAAASAAEAALFGGLAWTPYRWTAAGGETVLSFGATINPARVEVVKNGAVIAGNGDDYALSATQITMVDALVAGDRVEAKVFASFAVADALKPSQNLADLSSVVSARNNLGLGSAAILNAGTGANQLLKLDGTGKIPAVDGSQITGLPFSKGWESAEITIAGGNIYALTHTLGATPKLIDAVLVCKIAEHGFSVDDEYRISGVIIGSGNPPLMSFASTASDITAIFQSSSAYYIMHKTTRAWVNPTFGNWRLKIRACA